jgi:gas vesicle protein
MSEERPTEESLAEEFRQLGKNLTEVLRGAWDSPERKKLRQEISNGLSDISNMMRREVEYFRESPTKQRLQAEAEELRERIRTRDLENKARQELLSALHSINEQLRNVTQRWTEERSEQATTDRPAYEPDVQGRQEVHPDDVDTSANVETGHQEVHPDDVESAHGGDVPGYEGQTGEDDK